MYLYFPCVSIVCSIATLVLNMWGWRIIPNTNFFLLHMRAMIMNSLGMLLAKKQLVEFYEEEDVIGVTYIV